MGYLLLSVEQRTLRTIARGFEKPVPEVEMIKQQFDSFDNNGSGSIEYPEFAQLMNILIGVKGEDKVPDSRVKSFWRELDIDGSGEVEFCEFIPWYLGYFDTTGSPSGTTPLELYYRNIRPVPFPMNVA